jgi:phosphoglycerate dehydrogenase-like enzyme
LNGPDVLIYRPVDESGESHRRLADAGCRVLVTEAQMSRAELVERGRGAAALVGATFRGDTMDAAFLEAFPRLRIIAKYTIGVDDVDVDAATRLGIVVTHSPTEANWGGVAEGTLASILALTKRVRERDRQVKEGRWRNPELEGVFLGKRADGYAGICVGIIGLGRAGGRVADLLAPWRVRLLAHDPHVGAHVFARHGATPADLDSLLEQSDVVTVHCTLTDETRGMLDASRIGRMKPTAILVNTARGAIVDIDALCDALETERIAAAALDVLPSEPPPPGSRILALGDKVLLSPHMVAANAGGTLRPAIPVATDAVLAALSGRVPRNVYNAGVLSKWRARFLGDSLLGSGR